MDADPDLWMKPEFKSEFKHVPSASSKKAMQYKADKHKLSDHQPRSKRWKYSILNKPLIHFFLFLFLFFFLFHFPLSLWYVRTSSLMKHAQQKKNSDKWYIHWIVTNISMGAIHCGSSVGNLCACDTFFIFSTNKLYFSANFGLSIAFLLCVIQFYKY